MLATIGVDEEKLCRICGEYYPLEAFYKRTETRYSNICKACEAARRKEARDGEREVRHREVEWVGDRGYSSWGWQ